MKPYYDHGGIVIYHGDSREILPGFDRVDHVICDPPYECEAHTMQMRVKREGGVMEVEPLSFGPMTPELRDLIALESGRLSARWVLAFCQIEGAPVWRQSFESAGLIYKRTCLWIKPDGMPQYTGDRPGMGYEAFVAMHPEGRSKWNGGGRHGVFIVNKGGETGGEPNSHPTQKPHKLMTLLVNLFTDPGELILDPFMGSGTTLYAAKQLGRRAIGVELEEKHCETAALRLSQEVMDFS